MRRASSVSTKNRQFKNRSSVLSNVVGDRWFDALDSVIYLSDLPWDSAANNWGPVERDTSNGENLAGDGRTLSINGVTFAKGLGAHATSDIVYSVESRYLRFLATVGLDDENGSANGTVFFQVYLDGVKAFDSGLMTNGATNYINLNLTGVQSIRLHLDDAGDGAAHDHGDWAIARFVTKIPQLLFALAGA